MTVITIAEHDEYCEILRAGADTPAHHALLKKCGRRGVAVLIAERDGHQYLQNLRTEKTFLTCPDGKATHYARNRWQCVHQIWQCYGSVELGRGNLNEYTPPRETSAGERRIKARKDRQASWDTMADRIGRDKVAAAYGPRPLDLTPEELEEVA